MYLDMCIVKDAPSYLKYLDVLPSAFRHFVAGSAQCHDRIGRHRQRSPLYIQKARANHLIAIKNTVVTSRIQVLFCVTHVEKPTTVKVI